MRGLLSLMGEEEGEEAAAQEVKSSKKASILNHTHHCHNSYSYSYIIMITVVNVKILGRSRDKQWRGKP